MDRGAHGEEGEAGQVRRGLIHCQALAQGQEGQVVRQEPGEAVVVLRVVAKQRTKAYFYLGLLSSQTLTHIPINNVSK